MSSLILVNLLINNHLKRLLVHRLDLLQNQIKTLLLLQQQLLMASRWIFDVGQLLIEGGIEPYQTSDYLKHVAVLHEDPSFTLDDI